MTDRIQNRPHRPPLPEGEAEQVAQKPAAQDVFATPDRDRRPPRAPRKLGPSAQAYTRSARMAAISEGAQASSSSQTTAADAAASAPSPEPAPLLVPPRRIAPRAFGSQTKADIDSREQSALRARALNEIAQDATLALSEKMGRAQQRFFKENKLVSKKAILAKLQVLLERNDLQTSDKVLLADRLAQVADNHQEPDARDLFMGARLAAQAANPDEMHGQLRAVLSAPQELLTKADKKAILMSALGFLSESNTQAKEALTVAILRLESPRATSKKA